MKIVRILPLAAIACAMVSCQNMGGGLSETSTQTDSLMYYLGEINASDYLRDIQRDSTLNETSSKQAYLAGVKAGLNVLREGDDNYNRGVMLGVQMANNMVGFSEQMGVEIDKNVYYSSLEKAVMSDTIPNSQGAQIEFRQVLTNIENAKKQKDEASSRASLKKDAETAGLPMISEDLYGKVTTTNDSAVIKDGDELDINVEVTKIDGSVVRLPLQKKVKLGVTRSLPEVLKEALLKLRTGETGEFMTSAHAITDGRSKQFDLEPEEVLKVKLSASILPTPENK